MNLERQFEIAAIMSEAKNAPNEVLSSVLLKAFKLDMVKTNNVNILVDAYNADRPLPNPVTELSIENELACVTAQKTIVSKGRQAMLDTLKHLLEEDYRKSDRIGYIAKKLLG